jgi:hypothetical protein
VWVLAADTSLGEEGTERRGDVAAGLHRVDERTVIGQRELDADAVHIVWQRGGVGDVERGAKGDDAAGLGRDAGARPPTVLRKIIDLIVDGSVGGCGAPLEAVIGGCSTVGAAVRERRIRLLDGAIARRCAAARSGKLRRHHSRGGHERGGNKCLSPATARMDPDTARRSEVHTAPIGNGTHGTGHLLLDLVCPHINQLIVFDMGPASCGAALPLRVGEGVQVSAP